MTPCILAGLGRIIPAISYFSTISVALYYGLLIAMMTVGKEARQIGIHEGTKYPALLCLISLVPGHLEKSLWQDNTLKRYIARYQELFRDYSSLSYLLQHFRQRQDHGWF